MSAEAELYSLSVQKGIQPLHLPLKSSPVHEFLAGEYKGRGDVGTGGGTNLHTRSECLCVWPSVRHVAVYRNEWAASAASPDDLAPSTGRWVTSSSTRTCGAPAWWRAQLVARRMIRLSV